MHNLVLHVLLFLVDDMALFTAAVAAFMLGIDYYIIAVITKPCNCIWKNVKITTKKRLLIQLFTTV